LFLKGVYIMSIVGTLRVYGVKTGVLRLTVTQRGRDLDLVARGLVARLNVAQDRYDEDCVIGCTNFEDLTNFVQDSEGEYVLTVTI
jgi:hypothetical protein